jgi:hypothetical protein
MEFMKSNGDRNKLNPFSALLLLFWTPGLIFIIRVPFIIYQINFSNSTGSLFFIIVLGLFFLEVLLILLYLFIINILLIFFDKVCPNKWKF